MYEAELRAEPMTSFPEISGTSEWTYINCMADWWAVQLQVGRILEGDMPSSLRDKLNAAHRVYDEYNMTLPLHLQVRDPQPGDPPWVFAQACALQITTVSAVIDLYRPYFHEEAMALGHALVAAKSLINTAQALTSYLMFRWIDAPSAQLWEFGSKVFSGGLVMAYALLQESDLQRQRGWESDEGCEISPGSDSALRASQLTALETAIGALRVCGSQNSGSGDLPRKSLKILEILRNVIIQRQSGRESSSDPYGEIIGVLNQDSTAELDDWVKWDGMYQELFTGYNDILESINLA